MARFLPYLLPPALLLYIHSASANFVVQSPASDTGPDFGDSVVADDPAASGGGNPGQAVHWKMADGFGTSVPLQFACRQIVPPAVKVTFGPGVNPATPVSWKGGDTWNHVLRATLKPAGLSLQMGYMAVAITKNTPP